MYTSAIAKDKEDDTKESSVNKEKQPLSDDWIYRMCVLFGGVFIFILTLYISNTMIMDHAPDEYMRIQIPFWIVSHGALPNGDEHELLNPIWGFSYGFTPYLPSLFASLFIKIASVFTENNQILLAASRFVSVLSITITWYVCCKIADRIIKTYACRILFSFMCCGLPQLIFLGSYFNNDMFGVMCSALIGFGWLRGDQDGWNVKRVSCRTKRKFA